MLLESRYYIFILNRWQHQCGVLYSFYGGGLDDGKRCGSITTNLHLGVNSVNYGLGSIYMEYITHDLVVLQAILYLMEVYVNT